MNNGNKCAVFVEANDIFVDADFLRFIALNAIGTHFLGTNCEVILILSP